MILTRWASIFVAVILPLPTISPGIPQQYPGYDLNSSITFEIVGVTETVPLEYYYHAVSNELMWGKPGTITESDVRVQFEETSTFYLHIQSGMITYYPVPVNNAGASIKIMIDHDNSQSILDNSYICRQRLSQADNGLVHSFPPEYRTDQSPPLDDYVKLGAIARTHDISAATADRVGPDEVLLTIPPAPETNLQNGSVAHHFRNIQRLMTLTDWDIVCRIFVPLGFGYICSQAGFENGTGDYFSAGLLTGAAGGIFAGYVILGTILNLRSRAFVAQAYAQQVEMAIARGPGNQAAEATIPIPSSSRLAIGEGGQELLEDATQ